MYFGRFGARLQKIYENEGERDDGRQRSFVAQDNGRVPLFVLAVFYAGFSLFSDQARARNYADAAIDSCGRMIWVADVHRGDGKRFVVRRDEILAAFVELESAIRAAPTFR
jgi:hypothetical protein